MKQPTLKQATKTKYASNQQFILEELKLTDLEHNNLVLDIGCKFLEKEFPRNDLQYDKWYKEFAYSKSFWKWWRLEWNNWLSILIEKKSFYEGANIHQAMAILIFRSATKDSFHNQYIKLLHNGNTNI